MRKQGLRDEPKGRMTLVCVVTFNFRPRGPFLEAPGNLMGPKSDFEIKVSRKVGRVVTSNEVRFVSLANNFTVQYSKLLKLLSGVENKTA